MEADTKPGAADAKHLSSKLKTMKFMQRSEDRARADAERKIEQKRADESHWRAIYPDEIFSESKARTRVIYEPSYLKMPVGDTAVRGDGSRGDGGSGNVALGRRSFKSFNAQVEQAAKDVEARQRDEHTAQFEQREGVNDEDMAAALSTKPSAADKRPTSLREQNGQAKRKRN
ncbi:hypothetical protein H4S01_004943 [Coemansia sp. RSA 2610]|nr:hypothetical protein H4S01_004943 [Coemansia sp. RSA 2610]